MPTVRVFSLVRKIQTEFKADIQNDTHSALLANKMPVSQISQCYDFAPSMSLQKAANLTTSEYNKSSSCRLFNIYCLHV